MCIFFVLSGQVLTRGAFGSELVDLSGRFLRRSIRLGIPLLATNLLVLALLETGMMNGFKHPTLGNLWWVPAGVLTVSSAFYSAFVGTPFRGDVRWQIVHWSLRFEFLGSYLAIAMAAVFRARRHTLAILGVLAVFVGWLWSPYFSAFLSLPRSACFC